MRNADMPAMPIANSDGFTAHPASGSIDPGTCAGLTKCEDIAKAAMQGILAGDTNHDYTAQDVSEWAVRQADCLLAELDKEAQS